MHVRPLLAGVALVGGLATGWWLLAPQTVGGSMAYLAVRGSSMEPTFHPGDLVVVRAGPPYEPGDVVAYRTPASAPGLGARGDASADGEEAAPVIVHRVVGLDGERLVLRGDANAADDALRPAPQEVLGRQVARVPGVGGVFAGVRQSAGVAVVAVAAVLGWAAMSRRSRGRRRAGVDLGAPRPAAVIGGAPRAMAADGEAEGGAEGEGVPAVRPARRPSGDPIEALAVRRFGPPWLWGLLGAVVLLAAAVVARTPATTEQRASEPWTVRTSFGWDADPAGDPQVTAVYGEDGLRTGDTVFTAVTPLLPLQVASTLSLGAGGDAPSGSPGAPAVAATLAAEATVTVEVTVVSDAGWRRAVAILPPQPLEAGWAQADLVIDLPAAWAAAMSAGSAAGRLGEVRLEVVASTTAVDGSVEAAAVQAFVLDEVAAEPIPPEVAAGSVDSVAPRGTGGPSGVSGVPVPAPDAPLVATADALGAPGDAGADPPTGTVAIEGAIETGEVVPAEVALGPFAVARTPASLAIASAALIVLVGGVLSLLATGRARRGGEASLLVTRYRWSLVPLRTEPAALGGAPVEVASFEALRRVAGTVGQPIGVCCNDGETDFWVTDGVRAWRYATSAG